MSSAANGAQRKLRPESFCIAIKVVVVLTTNILKYYFSERFFSKVILLQA